MMMIMPVVFTFLFITSPSGLALYWLASNVLLIGQQVLTNYLIGPPIIRVPRPPAERRLKSGRGKDRRRPQRRKNRPHGKLTARSNRSRNSRDFVSQVVKQMGLGLEARVETNADGTRINLEGDGAEVLLAKRGEGLQALQHIVDSAFRRQLGEHKRLLIDCMDFRKGKDNELKAMAKFLAEKAKIVRRGTEHRPAERLRAAAGASGRGGSARRDLRKHRRRGGEDRHDFRERRRSNAVATCHVSTLRHHRRHRDAAGPWRDWCGAHQRHDGSARGRRALLQLDAPLQPRHATFARVKTRPGGGHLLPRSPFLHRRRRRRNQRARQPRRAAADPRGCRWRPARGWPNRASSRSARF